MQEKQDLERSYSRFLTKIHAACDLHGNTLRFILTGGEASNYRYALALIDGMEYDALLADKGHQKMYMK